MNIIRSLWTGRRGLVLGLISLGVVINYADRQIIAVLKPMLQEDLGWTDGDYGRMTSAFQFAAAFSFPGAGWLADRIGWRRANPLAVSLWSLAAMSHAVACTVGLKASRLSRSLRPPWLDHRCLETASAADRARVQALLRKSTTLNVRVRTPTRAG